MKIELNDTISKYAISILALFFLALIAGSRGVQFLEQLVESMSNSNSVIQVSTDRQDPLPTHENYGSKKNVY